MSQLSCPSSRRVCTTFIHMVIIDVVRGVPHVELAVEVLRATGVVIPRISPAPAHGIQVIGDGPVDPGGACVSKSML
ncbi:MAG: hypothetical protein ACLVKA_01585 [Collinsella aerofaciens]